MSGVKRPRARKPAAPPPPADRMPDRPAKSALFWRKQKQLLRRSLLLLALLAVGLAGLGLAQAMGRGASFGERLADTSARFGLVVRDIRIEGRLKTPEDQVEDALGVRVGDPILGFSVREARARLEAIAWVRGAVVERRLPDLVVVRLAERAPFAIWQKDGRFNLIDRDGNMVSDGDVATFSGQLPLVVGEGANTAAAALMEQLAAQPDLQSRLVAAVRVGDRRWNLRMSNGADILLPEGAEVAALARLAQLQATHALLDRPLQAVDLRLPDRLVIRPAVDKPLAQRKPT